MISAILWTLLGAVFGAFTISLFAWKKSERIAMLERANKRLLADVVTAAIKITELERELEAQKSDQ
jgi:hypothetical protein